MSAPVRVEVLGVPISCVDMHGAVSEVEDAIKKDRKLTVLAVNPEKVMVARKDPATMESLRKADLLIPDGIGVVMAVRLLFGANIGRVPGADLMPEICALAARKGYRVFLYGASPVVNESLVGVLKERYPGLQIAGNQHGFVSEEEMPGLIDRINASKADVIFVALGSPRQELWIERHLPELSVKIYQGVGGTFNVLTGEVKRAPALFQKLHLEWLYRLVSEPSRISRQIVYPLFAARVFWQKLTGA